MNIETKYIQRAAQYRWHEILTALGIPPESLSNKHQPCPMCGGKDRFRYDDKDGNGTYICNQCGAGNGFTFIMKFCGYEFKDAINAVKRILGLDNTNPLPIPKKPVIAQPRPRKQEDKQPKLMRLWHEAHPLTNQDPVINYLTQRGLTPDSTIQALRYHPALPYWQPNQSGKYQHIGDFPAMIGAIYSHDGQLMGLHQTYLHQQSDTFHKLPPPFTAKKMQSRYQGSLNGCAVPLYPIQATGKLIVAEGIETALAARELTRNNQEYGLYAALSANGIKTLVLPNGLQELLIIADHDTPRPIGYQAAHALAMQAIKQGIRTNIWQPQTENFDALDELLRLRAEQTSPAAAILNKLKTRSTPL